jgi:hypothetical protein
MDVGERRGGSDMELIKMAMLLFLGLWGRLLDVQSENSIEFVNSETCVHSLDFILLVVKHADFVGEF